VRTFHGPPTRPRDGILKRVPGASHRLFASHRLGTYALALAIGGAGGWLASIAQIPLAWMIGAMTATTLAAVPGLPVAIPRSLRNVMIAVLGVMLGSAFTPEIVQRIGEWSISLSALALYSTVAGAASYAYFRRVCGYDKATAYFSAMPGGLSEMILVGSAMGGDSRIISLTHASRILLVVLTLPFAFQLLTGYEPGTRPPVGLPLFELPPWDLAILSVGGAVGFVLARALRFPAAALLGPMLLSAGMHLAGWTAAKPPLEFVAAAQIVVGTAVGCRFAGTNATLILRAMIAAAGGTAILVVATLAFALAVTQVTGLSLEALVLAYAPGGLAEMSLIALAVGADSAFVATHHIARVILIIGVAPMLFRAMRKARERRERSR
jgi:uncharacterized protein